MSHPRKKEYFQDRAGLAGKLVGFCSELLRVLLSTPFDNWFKEGKCMLDIKLNALSFVLSLILLGSWALW